MLIRLVHVHGQGRAVERLVVLAVVLHDIVWVLEHAQGATDLLSWGNASDGNLLDVSIKR